MSVLSPIVARLSLVIPAELAPGGILSTPPTPADTPAAFEYGTARGSVYVTDPRPVQDPQGVPWVNYFVQTWCYHPNQAAHRDLLDSVWGYLDQFAFVNRYGYGSRVHWFAEGPDPFVDPDLKAWTTFIRWKVVTQRQEP